jgi:hypothetical protein
MTLNEIWAQVTPEVRDRTIHVWAETYEGNDPNQKLPEIVGVELSEDNPDFEGSKEFLVLRVLFP